MDGLPPWLLLLMRTLQPNPSLGRDLAVQQFLGNQPRAKVQAQTQGPLSPVYASTKREQDALEALDAAGYRRGMAVDTSLNRRLYEAIPPYSYDDMEGTRVDRAIQALSGEMPSPRERRRPEREDAWLLYLGLPQVSETLSPSSFRPSRSREDIPYFSFDRTKFLENVSRAHYGQTAAQNEPIRSLLEILGEENKTVVGDNYMGVMGHFTLSKGRDSSGPYVSYYDRWDLDQNPVEGREGRFGRPFEIYDRIYYDPITLKPVGR